MANSIFLSTELSNLNFQADYALRSSKDENGRTFIELKKFDFKNALLNLICLGNNDPQTLGLIEYFKAWLKISEFAIPTIKKTIKTELCSLQKENKNNPIYQKNITYLNRQGFETFSKTTNFINSPIFLFNNPNSISPNPPNQPSTNLNSISPNPPNQSSTNPNSISPPNPPNQPSTNLNSISPNPPNHPSTNPNSISPNPPNHPSTNLNSSTWNALSFQQKLDLIKKNPNFQHLPMRFPKSFEEFNTLNLEMLNFYETHFYPETLWIDSPNDANTYTIPQLKWLSWYFHKLPAQWKELSLKTQINLSSKQDIFPPLTYSTNPIEIKNLSKEEAKFLHQTFDPQKLLAIKSFSLYELFNSKSPNHFQKPKLFEITPSQRKRLFLAYITLFDKYQLSPLTDLPKLFKKLRPIPDKTHIQTLTQKQLEGYCSYFNHNQGHWHSLPLDVKFAFISSLSPSSLSKFPNPLSKKTPLTGLKELINDNRVEAIQYLFDHKFFEITNWFQIDLKTQKKLKNIFQNPLNVIHQLPLHPTLPTAVSNMDQELISIYYHLFCQDSPLIFQDPNILTAFADRFIQDKLDLKSTLFEKSTQSAAFDLWLQIVFAKRKDLWDLLSFESQFKIKTQRPMNGFYPIPHPYKSPSPIATMTQKHIFLFHQQYKNESLEDLNNSSWWTLTPKQQKTFNAHFKKLPLIPKKFLTYSDLLQNGYNFISENGQVTSFHRLYWDHFNLKFNGKKGEILSSSDQKNWKMITLYVSLKAGSFKISSIQSKWWELTLDEQKKYNEDFKKLQFKPLPTHLDLINKKWTFNDPGWELIHAFLLQEKKHIRSLLSLPYEEKQQMLQFLNSNSDRESLLPSPSLQKNLNRVKQLIANNNLNAIKYLYTKNFFQRKNWVQIDLDTQQDLMEMFTELKIPHHSSSFQPSSANDVNQMTKGSIFFYYENFNPDAFKGENLFFNPWSNSNNNDNSENQLKADISILEAFVDQFQKYSLDLTKTLKPLATSHKQILWNKIVCAKDKKIWNTLSRKNQEKLISCPPHYPILHPYHMKTPTWYQRLFPQSFNRKVVTIEEDMNDEHISSQHNNFKKDLNLWWQLSFNEQKAYNKRFENLRGLSPQRFLTYLDTINNPNNSVIFQNGQVNQLFWNLLKTKHVEVLNSLSKSEKAVLENSYFHLEIYVTLHLNPQSITSLNNPWWGKYSLKEQQKLNAEFAKINLKSLPTHSDLIQNHLTSRTTPWLIKYARILRNNKFEIWNSLEHLDQKKMLKIFKEKNFKHLNAFKITRTKPLSEWLKHPLS